MEDSKPQQLILVVDDRQDRLQTIKQVLVTAVSSPQIVELSTTEAAIDFLCSPKDLIQNHRPDLVLINAHLEDGQAGTILSTIKTNPKLKQIPTIILASEASDDDILNSYQQQCNSFILKPQDLGNLSQTLRAIESFWLNLVTLPI